MDFLPKKRRSIMAVDDDIINQMTLEAILSVNYDFTAVSSGPEALAQLPNQSVDLILLDINMPEMNGFEVLAALQANEATKDIPVIILTGDSDQETEVQGIQAGAFDFVHKPFIPTLILRRIERTLELKSLQHHMQQEIDQQTAIAKEQLASTRRLFRQMVETLADTIDAKDKYTNGHSRRVADYAREIARRAGKSEAYQNAVYYMARMLDGGEDPLFIARRLCILAAEDIGLANPNALLLANACFQIVNSIGMPEARIPLSETAIYLASSPKSNAAYLAIDSALAAAAADKTAAVPLYLRNAPTKLMEELGYADGYRYAHDFPGHFTDLEFMPEGLEGKVFYEPQPNPSEDRLKAYLAACWPKYYPKK